MILVRYLEPREHRDHGHVLIVCVGRRILELEIDPEGDVVLTYSNRNPGGQFRAWVFK